MNPTPPSSPHDDVPLPSWSSERQAAVANLAIDAMSGEAIKRLREAGVETVLLKGPVIARRLYGKGETRPYMDCDLLVASRDLPAAEATVAAMEMVFEPSSTPRWEWHAHSWWHADRHFRLELHWTLMHVGADPDTLWEVTNRGATVMAVGGVDVPTPCDSQLAVILALHAAQHGTDWSRPQEDLRRALDTFSVEVWRSAAERAGELDALPAFAAGLRLTTPGRSIADRLDLPEARSFEVWLTTGTAGAEARVVDRFVRAPGVMAKARVAAETAFPSATYMRRTRPVARHGRVGLALAYLGQPWYVVRHLMTGLRAWRRGRRMANGDP